MSRFVFFNLDIFPEVDNAVECPDCGFESLIPFHGYSMTDDGVSDLGTIGMRCVRCADLEDEDG